MATLAELRTRARQRADMELGVGQSDTTHFITNSELNSYINASAAELQDLVVKSDGDYYLDDYDFSTTTGTLAYNLPADFYKLKTLIYSESGRAIKKFNWKEKSKGGVRYRIKGSQIIFNRDPGALNLTMWYHTKQPTLSLDADAFDGINQFEEYIVVDSAIKMLTKEESDTSILYAQKQDLAQRIKEMADDRDAGDPDSISDVQSRSYPYLDPRGWEMDD